MQAQVDDRVQAIRCMGCHRLRGYPRGNIDATRACSCGSIAFMATVPHDDELQIAAKLYEKEIEEYLCRHPSVLREE